MSETVFINTGPAHHATTTTVNTAQVEAVANVASGLTFWKVMLFLLLVFIILVLLVAAFRWYNCSSKTNCDANANPNYKPLNADQDFW